MVKRRNLIDRGHIFSTTPKSKYISVSFYNEPENKHHYIKKTKANMAKLKEKHGNPDVYKDKRYKKRSIWW